MAALIALVLLQTATAAMAALPARAVQLAEILGAVHHLRDVCGTNEGQLWRNKMIEMLGVLEPTDTERQQLVKNFNDSYYRYKNTYPACTATAARQSDKLMQDGQRLAEELAASGLGR
ncbi:MAG: TIGR02301 family protein [Alphaproteobacteria bacterium]|nr:TIGR02301 family protein [Alphaproteobacteria bacterium]MDX5416408.1 TIGR02301 family protein [Alphaproteobacteria bacterium]MDX5493766.1 TIGR02301 family protein [Alphaproteobacteria bacterium]